AAMLEEEDASTRWSVLARKVLDYCRDQTLSNVQGISATLLLLGIQSPWKLISERAGVPETALRTQIQTLVKRRNDITHRGDRPVGQPEAPPQPIDLTWASSHVNAVHSVVSASHELAREAIAHLVPAELVPV